MRRKTAAPAKNVRMNEALREWFEGFCRDHALDQRLVIEAWILGFLEATDEERLRMVRRYNEWERTLHTPSTESEASHSSPKGRKPRV